MNPGLQRCRNEETLTDKEGFLDPRIIFGNENAEKDALLYECPVRTEQPSVRKSILIGRWGTGKTAILLLQNEELSKRLRRINPELERCWYVSEHSLDLKALVDLQSTFDGDDSALLRALEGLWRAELLRVYCIVLATLRTTYRKHDSAPWKFVSTVAQSSEIRNAIWTQIPNALEIITGRKDVKGPTTKIAGALSKIIDDRAKRHVLSCLRDIDRDELVPTIAVEPIETPSAELEKRGSLAQLIITALLNVFVTDFQPSERNNVRIRISIPWHRYRRDQLDFPQKHPQYVGTVAWSPKKLREFIDSRIRWEFSRVGRRFRPKGGKDAWSTPFEERTVNSLCNPSITEDTFDYFLRHTHHRARDLQRLVRSCVETQAEVRSVDVDEVLSGVVEARVIRETFLAVGRGLTEELILEGGRRYPALHKLTNEMYGVPLPFTTDELKKRADRASVRFDEALAILWSVGVIGFMIPNGDNDTDRTNRTIRGAIGAAGKRVYTNASGAKVTAWFWFEYNYDRPGPELLKRLGGLGFTSVPLILHPKTQPFFAPSSYDKRIPLGI